MQNWHLNFQVMPDSVREARRIAKKYKLDWRKVCDSYEALDALLEELDTKLKLADLESTTSNIAPK